MDAIKTLLFEDPTAVYCAAGFAELILFFLLWRRRTRRLALSCLVPPIVAALVGLMAFLVTTDRERINNSLQQIARAAVANNVEAVGGFVDPAYNDGRYNKQTLLAAMTLLRHLEDAKEMDGFKLLMLKIDVDGASATSHFRARLFKGDSPLGDTEWEVRWIRHNVDWRVVSSKLIEPRGVPMAPGN